MDAAALFIRPVFSKQVSPSTKLGEFLGCSIPCLSNTGIGDMMEILEGESAGVVGDSFDETALDVALKRFLGPVADPAVRGRCVAAAHACFSLKEGVAHYRRVYRSLLPEAA